MGTLFMKNVCGVCLTLVIEIACRFGRKSHKPVRIRGFFEQKRFRNGVVCLAFFLFGGVCV